jgi:hypothetical protein
LYFNCALGQKCSEGTCADVINGEACTEKPAYGYLCTNDTSQPGCTTSLDCYLPNNRCDYVNTICQAGTPKVLGAPCLPFQGGDNLHCDDGLTCLNNVCSTGCDSNNDCSVSHGAGYYCETTTNECVSGVCSSAGDCGAGFACHQFQCIPTGGGPMINKRSAGW